MEYSARDVVNLAINNDAANLDKVFDSAMRTKIIDAIETRKTEIANSIGTQKD